MGELSAVCMELVPGGWPSAPAWARTLCDGCALYDQCSAHPDRHGSDMHGHILVWVTALTTRICVHIGISDQKYELFESMSCSLMSKRLKNVWCAKRRCAKGLAHCTHITPKAFEFDQAHFVHGWHGSWQTLQKVYHMLTRMWKLRQ